VHRQPGRVPFTFFHPAAVVPLLRNRLLIPAGLVIGAMSPDFEYFLRLNTISVFTHTPAGLVYACVPLGLLALVAWQGVIRDPLVGALPGFLRNRLAGVGTSGIPLGGREWLVAALSVLIGAATHLLWDSFTHPGYLPARWLGLTAPSVIPGVPWTGVLQRSSDLVGFVVLAVVIARLPRQARPAARSAWLFWLVTAVTVVSTLALRTLLEPDWLTLSRFIATVIAGGLLGLFLAALVALGQESAAVTRTSRSRGWAVAAGAGGSQRPASAATREGPTGL